MFQKTRDSLRFYEQPEFTLPLYLSKYDYLKTRFGASTHPHITASFWGLKASMPLDSQTVSAVRGGTLPSEFMEFALGGLRLESMKSGKFAAALDYDLRLQALFPDSRFLKQYPIPPRALPVVQYAQQQFDSLERRDLPEDERLWAIGQIWWRYCARKPVSDPDNFQLAFKYLDELLRSFPQSQWADDAAFLRLKTLEETSNPDMNYTESRDWARQYEALFRKYPNSALQPEMLYRAALNYAWFQKEGDNPREACMEADSTARQLLREFPDFAQKNGIDDLLSYIRQKKMIYDLDLSVSADKQTYQYGEPVWVTFALINRSDERCEFELDFAGDCPNFVLTMQEWGKGKSLALAGAGGKCTPTRPRIILAPGETYQERWDITRIPEVFKRVQDDGVRFPEPGRYLLRGHIEMKEPVKREIVYYAAVDIRIEK